MAQKNRDEKQTHGELAGIVHRNIQALLQVRQKFEQQRTWHERLIDTVTAFVGSAKFLVTITGMVAVWIAVNVGLVPGLKPFDPYPFVMLAMIASVMGILIATMVLITQNRQAAMAEKRADLDLQINLLAEHEVTRLIQLVDAMATHLGMPRPPPRDLSELKQDVAPEKVLREIEKAAEALPPTGEPPTTTGTH